jgi:hypothetical protein
LDERVAAADESSTGAAPSAGAEEEGRCGDGCSWCGCRTTCPWAIALVAGSERRRGRIGEEVGAVGHPWQGRRQGRREEEEEETLADTMFVE